MSAGLSGETVEFVRSSFESVWALELLLLMRGERSRLWRIDELIQELRASDLIVKRILPDFVKKGLVAEAGGESFQYRPAEGRIEKMVDRIANAYAENRVEVIEEILSAPNENIRIFAEAFRIKKD
jgi:hypothetical protein